AARAHSIHAGEVRSRGAGLSQSITVEAGITAGRRPAGDLFVRAGSLLGSRARFDQRLSASAGRGHETACWTGTAAQLFAEPPAGQRRRDCDEVEPSLS